MKNFSHLVLLFVVASLWTAPGPALAQPTLGIAPAANNQSLLYFTPSVTDYILQSATNAASPAWLTVPDAVGVTAVLVSNSLPARFFRLMAAAPPTGMALIPGGAFTLGNSMGDSDITDAAPTNVYVSAFF